MLAERDGRAEDKGYGSGGSSSDCKHEASSASSIFPLISPIANLRTHIFDGEHRDTCDI